MLKIDIIYAYPLLAGGVGLLILLLAYWIWRLQCRMTATLDVVNYALSMCVKDVNKFDADFKQSISNIEQTISELKQINIERTISELKQLPTPKERAFLRFYTMHAAESSLGIEMKIPMLEMVFPTPGKPAQQYIFWEGLVYIVKENLEIDPNNLESVMAGFKNWQSKPVLE